MHRLESGELIVATNVPDADFLEEFVATLHLGQSPVQCKDFDNVEGVLTEIDVLYVTRIQKERFAAEAEYKKLKGSYVIDEQSLKKLKKNAIIMHPLPRVDEIAPEVDSDPRALYSKRRHATEALLAVMTYLLDIPV